jgi:hypothetical protein
MPTTKTTPKQRPRATRRAFIAAAALATLALAPYAAKGKGINPYPTQKVENSTASRIIDRFEGGLALLENPETLETKEFPRAELPEGANEGDVLIEADGALRINRSETEARAARIGERFCRLKRN